MTDTRPVDFASPAIAVPVSPPATRQRARLATVLGAASVAGLVLGAGWLWASRASLGVWACWAAGALLPLALALERTLSFQRTLAVSGRAAVERAEALERLRASEAAGLQIEQASRLRLDALTAQIVESRDQLRRVMRALPGTVLQFRLDEPFTGGLELVFRSGRTEAAGSEAELSLLLVDRKRWGELIHPDDLSAFIQSAGAAIRSGGLWNHVFRARLGDSLRWVRARASADRGAAGLIFTGFFTDVTEEIKLTEGLQRAKRQEMMGELASGMAHNFNNVLVAVLANVEEAQALVPEDHPARPPLKDALTAGRSARDLVRQLMALASSEAAASPAPVNLPEACRQAVGMFRSTVDRRIAVTERIELASRYVSGQASEIQQLVLNLCLNARDAVEQRPNPTVEVSLVEEPRDEVPGGAWLLLSVRDNGHGMSPDTLARLGEPFFTTKGPGRGTGLGVASIYGVARAMGGRVEVTSTLDVGTTFRVRLPMVDAPPQPPAPTPVQAALPPGHRLLIIDDDATVRRGLRRQLERLGAVVEEVGSGAEALARLAQTELPHPAAVLLDLSMPEMSGTEVLAALTRLYPGLPVVVLSGYVADPGSLPGAAAILLKPPSRDVVLATLRPLLENASVASTEKPVDPPPQTL